MISIPNFGTGAMENWGLITYRETNLLYDAELSSESNKQRVGQVVAHELVHQVSDSVFVCLNKESQKCLFESKLNVDQLE